MKKAKIFAGICWAFAGLLLIIILFPGLNSFSRSVSKLPFMKLNVRYTGGGIAKQIVMDNCTLNIRKPVFNGFLKERKSGFVQLEWHGIIPVMIHDSIDYDRDGNNDFIIFVDRNNSKTALNPLNPKVNGVDISTATTFGWAVRIGLLKE